MEKLTYIASYFERSESMTYQGTRASIQPYLDAGYSVKMSKNGNWRLAKPAHAWFEFKKPSGKNFHVDLRAQIMTHYDKQRFSEATYNRFVKELSDGIVKVCLDDSNNCVIV